MSSPSGSGGDLTERRGIRAAKFLQDVETYLSQSGLDPNSALAFHQERLQQYKVVEMKLLAQQRDLQAKIPDIEKCLEVVATLEARKGTGEGIVLEILVGLGLIKSHHFWLEVEQIEETLQNVLVCLEMIVFSVIQQYAFHVAPYSGETEAKMSMSKRD